MLLQVVARSLGILALALGLAACTASVGETRAAVSAPVGVDNPDVEHARLFAANAYPSAQDCRPCHQTHYREWSVSSHAYAQLSPVFNAMQATLIRQTSGTLGDFCIRCHTPIGMELGEPVVALHSDRAPVSNEGVTCIVCHRVNRSFGKVSGRFPINRGDLFEPVVGPSGNDELTRVLENPDEFKNLVTEPGTPGRRVHGDVEPFFEMTNSGFCGRCHDVRSIDGFRLEDAFSEYKKSPSAARGESCQDCHMGEEPGVPGTYSEAPAATIGSAKTRVRKHTNHMVTGPDYSIVHPALFPHNPELFEFAELDEWLSFDVDAGWGTDAFEDEVSEEHPFPERWAWAEDRYDARDLLQEQLDLLDEGFERGRELLKQGYRLGDIQVKRADSEALSFEVEISNGTDGHATPTGFTAERLVFLRVSVTNPDGEVVYRSGDLDPNGDLRDSHSLYVHAGQLARDADLLSLQSKFITRNLRGSEREQILTPNFSPDPLPYTRPSSTATLAFGRPLGGRLQKFSIEPGGSRAGNYRVTKEDLVVAGEYRIDVELVAGMVPINLVGAIQHEGFDFDLSPREVADRIVAGHRVLWSKTASVHIGEAETSGE